MITNTNVPPAPVVAAIFARFHPDVEELHFSTFERRVYVYDFCPCKDGSWVCSATHISGADLVIVVAPDLTVTFEIWCNRCRSAPCECV